MPWLANSTHLHDSALGNTLFAHDQSDQGLHSWHRPLSEYLEYICREPDKIRIFVNYALKTPEYECLSNFNLTTYCCHFSAYARGFVLFRTYESRSGDAEFGR